MGKKDNNEVNIYGLESAVNHSCDLQRKPDVPEKNGQKAGVYIGIYGRMYDSKQGREVRGT